LNNIDKYTGNNVRKREREFATELGMEMGHNGNMKSYSRSGWLGSRVVSVLDSGAERPGFKSQPTTVLGKLFTPIVPLFTKQQNW